ncbi:methionine--tRNA ligase [Massilimicrobiota sp. An142]|uniref:methionine--tRNA ligase n=2 Tax=Bacillota TaxID=1239 RepID=UPI000B58395D|nr:MULTISPECIES: methionine--tRNA ligase [unclassified Massilimicrobiota]OUN36910.1 methionine--tRNA ligase [Massilimicrobiota sp. An80]OUQ11434.1 methionine--tRNA ligase [Massilimicrobiota sp. An142]OUQ30318.1 methionine--tRNA ligase [Massilimicrobiota sp. An134]
MKKGGTAYNTSFYKDVFYFEGGDMMKDPKDYYLTTAITYTSGKPHIGNTYEIILADAIARSKRQEGYNVYFQTGTDEHGQKIELKAQEAGIPPKQFVDEKAAVVKEIWDMMDTTYDRFMRTTDEYHVKQVQKIFKKLYDQGDIYLGHYEGKYCTACESFFTESQLVDGKCPDCGGEVHDAKEEAYFFKLSKYADRLIQHIEEHPEFIQPVSRKNEMMNNFLKPGLQDLCVSRTSFKWSIPVDFDPKHVVYVWIDALTNYITGLGYDVDGNHGELYKKYWPADLHLIGKDIVRFHTIYWPIMLMALDIPLPKQVFGHPWLLQGESKMSKSKGNVIYADDLVKIFGVDAVRYYVLHEIPYDNDGSITWDLLVERINSDLANILGNLVNRTIAMTNKYFDGIVTNPGVSEPVDDELKEIALAMPKKVQAYMDEFKASKALDEIFVLLRRTNKYIDDTMPWALAKDESKKDRLATVLYNLIEAIRFAAIALEPYMPSTSTKILDQINTDQRNFLDLNTFGLYQEGTKVTEKPQQLFARLDPKEVEKKVAALYPQKEEKQEDDNQITIDDFAKIELVVGTVEKCEKHPDADKLLVSQINIGKETRQIVSGIADFYTPEDMIGKKVIVVSNLKPAKLRGVESQGMILAGSKKKMLELVSVENLPNGTKIR